MSTWIDRVVAEAAEAAGDTVRYNRWIMTLREVLTNFPPDSSSR